MSGVLVGAAVIGAAGAVYSANKQSAALKNSANAQREATQAQSRSASVQTARDRMAQIREARIRAGAIGAAGGSEGVGQISSGIAGSISSIGSQAGSNIGAINVAQGFAQTASNAMQVSTDQQVKAQRWQQIGAISSQVASTAFTQAGGFTTIFGGNTIKKAGG
jgi:hypothetical protein